MLLLCLQYRLILINDIIHLYNRIEDWDEYLLWYVKSLKEAVETAQVVKKENEKELSALKVALPEPVKLCSNISIGITLPKPCAIKRKSADGPR